MSQPVNKSNVAVDDTRKAKVMPLVWAVLGSIATAIVLLLLSGVATLYAFAGGQGFAIAAMLAAAVAFLGATVVALKARPLFAILAGAVLLITVLIATASGLVPGSNLDFSTVTSVGGTSVLTVALGIVLLTAGVLRSRR